MLRTLLLPKKIKCGLKPLYDNALEKLLWFSATNENTKQC